MAFADRDAAIAIFRGWHIRYGKRDEDEELRISIVEGDIPGEQPGYSVFISTDSDVFIQRVKRAGYSYNESDSVFTIGRINRMNPDPGSPHLTRFKDGYRRFKTYWLVPGSIDAQDRVQVIPELRIFKSRIVFKDVSEIHSQDPDFAVLAKETG